jgi:hypothetical protein
MNPDTPIILCLRRDHLRELAVLHHVCHDVETTDEFAVNDELRERRPLVDYLET